MSGYSEAQWEEDLLEHLGEPLGWRPVRGEEIAPGMDERSTWDDLIIRPRLLRAMQQLNPTVPMPYLEQALSEIVSPGSQDAITENQRIHDILVKGYRLTYLDADGFEQNPSVRIISSDPDRNDWLAANQVTIRQGDRTRRFDIVLYVNGMPLSIIELKRAGSGQADASAAHAQLETYLREFPMAFRFCVLTLASDGIETIYGTPFTPLNHFAPWNVDDDGKPVEPNRMVDDELVTTLQDAAEGLFNQERFLQLLRDYTAFDEGDGGLAKRIAKPHQYFAVSKAVGKTIEAVRTNGKAGVVWHTQGSGKSMEMELYTALVMREPALKNPTVVVITDRKELDGQLFEGFDRSLLLPEKPTKIRLRSELRDQLSNRVTGGILFTTLQKFGLSIEEKRAGHTHPLLSDRRNIIVIVDEAHRSHYDDLDGYARHLRDALPNATLIAFTGTPISFDERDTQEVFGPYIDIYDLTRSVADGATVPVYFEPRLIRVIRDAELSEEDIDLAADEATTGLSEDERARIEASVAVVNAVYGAPERLEALAFDIVAHWEERRSRMQAPLESPGKALIVGGTREICARLYDEIVKLRPSWHSGDLTGGVIKVVYSGVPSDPSPIVEHVRRDSANAAIKERLKDPEDSLQLVIVKDMMLTGFDAPPLHTLYLDRPLKGALLMQTLARVNRTFRGKEDGLLVSYAPIVENLSGALAEYTVTDQEARPVGRNVDEAAALALDIIAEIRKLVGGYDWRATLAAGGSKPYLNAVAGTVQHLRDQQNPANAPELGADTLAARYRRVSGRLARAWALASGRDTLADAHDEIAFYQEVRVWMAKFDAAERKAAGQPIPEDIQRLLGGLIAEATDAGGVVDIYEAAGMERPSLSELTPEVVREAQQVPNPQLAIEALRAQLLEESAAVTRGNVIRQHAFSARIAELMNKYTNQQLTSAEVIAALAELAKEVSEESSRGVTFTPPLNDDELAFYDAVSQNESAVQEQGTGILAEIARELVAIMRRDVRTDWTVRADVKAKLRSSIKRLLVLKGYPPDRQPEAIKLVMEQMEAMAPRYAEEREAGKA